MSERSPHSSIQRRSPESGRRFVSYSLQAGIRGSSPPSRPPLFLSNNFYSPLFNDRGSVLATPCDCVTLGQVHVLPEGRLSGRYHSRNRIGIALIVSC